MQKKNILNSYKTILGQYCAISQFVELSKRCFLDEHALEIEKRDSFIALATKNKITLTSYDSVTMVNAISRSYIVNVNLCFETFLKDMDAEIKCFGKKAHNAKDPKESWLECVVNNVVGKLPKEYQKLYELCNYYRLVRNTAVHDLRDVRTLEVEYKKLKKYDFRKESKFSKLIAPNPYDEIIFDDFVMFSGSSVELATFLFSQIEYDYDKIVLDIPEELKTVWRRYGQSRCENAIYAYINTVYRADDSLNKQLPHLCNLVRA